MEQERRLTNQEIHDMFVNSDDYIILRRQQPAPEPEPKPTLWERVKAWVWSHTA